MIILKFLLYAPQGKRILTILDKMSLTHKQQPEWQILLFLQTSGPPTGRMPEDDEGEQTLSRCARSILLAQDLRHG